MGPKQDIFNRVDVLWWVVFMDDSKEQISLGSNRSVDELSASRDIRDTSLMVLKVKCGS